MILTPDPIPFHPGDVVRVLSHAPHGTRLLAGDVVTVAVVKVDTEDNTVLLVDTDDGRRALYATDVEVVSRVYRPAVPDPDTDDAFSAIMQGEMAADSDFASIFVEASVALGAVDDEVAASLVHDDQTDEDEEPGDTHTVTYLPPEDDDTSYLNVTDPWGDHAAFIYQEAHTPDGVVGRVMVYTDCEAGVQLRADHLPDLINWLKEKFERAKARAEEQ